MPANESELRAALGDVPLMTAGGASSIAADDALVTQLSRTSATDAVDVAIVVKAWEPPLLEFVDFVQAMRRVLGSGPEIVVYPLATSDAGALVPGDDAHVDVWRRQLGRVGDPWLRVAAGIPEARS